jgi:hypothetical protein
MIHKRHSSIKGLFRSTSTAFIMFHYMGFLSHKIITIVTQYSSQDSKIKVFYDAT